MNHSFEILFSVFLFIFNSEYCYKTISRADAVPFEGSVDFSSSHRNSTVAVTTWRVIGAGLGRSGTDSLKAALELLGLGPTYHMKEVLRGHPCTFRHVSDMWSVANNVSLETFREKLTCFQSGVDIPVAAYYRELMEIYPEAIVVLTRRPARLWAHSALRTICPAAVARGASFRPSVGPHAANRAGGIGNGVPWYVRVLRAVLPVAAGADPAAYRTMMAEIAARINAAEKWSPGTDNPLGNINAGNNWGDPNTAPSGPYCTTDVDTMSRLYDKWNAMVIATVPKDRLVIFETGTDGWDKLCGALNVSIPTRPYKLMNGSDITIPIPYPHINTGRDYVNMVRAQKGLAVVFITTPVLTGVMLMLYIYKKCIAQRGQRQPHIHLD